MYNLSVYSVKPDTHPLSIQIYIMATVTVCTTFASLWLSYSEGGDDQALEPFCQNYKGAYCGFLSSKSLFVTSRTDQINAENQVISKLSPLTFPLIPQAIPSVICPLIHEFYL